ncbi:MAG: sulfide/dihydroorotate dehydrogenase-like FAD/NAD-binding protein [Sedimentisphaerales bacterium]|nr:sulfide/dihydroorotate dehydrogenase-like FAD/NAD-binding protein [Sedimentisphaerales bacterium]
MFEIIAKETVGPNLTKYEILAPWIAKARKCGQFVMVRADQESERIPLTIADVNRETGTITLIVQTVGKSTLRMTHLEKGQCFADVAGPLGMPSHIEKYGTVVVVGGGLGTAVIYPQAVALRELGNKIITIIGARTKELVILEDILGETSDKVIITTDDGSYGRKGLVTHALQELIDDPETSVDAVYCAGPVVMMKYVAEVTRASKIPTMVSLNPIMVDGTGMCGGCRVTVGGETKFACVDGPEFDGHIVDYDELIDRLTTYRNHEQRSLDHFKQHHKCKCDGSRQNVDD